MTRSLVSDTNVLQGHQVVQNKSAGVVTSRSSLVLRGVRRQQAGRYSCEATNILARVRSAPVILTIKCKVIIRF